MNNSVQYLLSSLLLLIILATGYWFYNNFSWVTEEKEVGFQGIAKTNNLLAAEFFLRRMGVKARQVNGLLAFRNLPSTQHTLMISTQRETVNKELSQLLKKWVNSGGHLIVEARFVANQEKKEMTETVLDPLLDELSVYKVRNTNKYSQNDSATRFTLPQDKEQAELEVHFPHYRILNRSENIKILPDWVIEDERGVYLMQFSLGDGLLTIMNSTNVFNNDNLDKNDNAHLLHYLTQREGFDSEVWLIQVDDMPSLWTWLWENAWYTMFCLSLLFGLWLWRAPLRFGPILNDAQTERRSLLEHIRASGYYRWHEEQSSFLLSRVQENLWEKIQIAHPVVRRENPMQAYALLAEITSINEALIKQALMPVEEINEHEFTKVIRILENIRKHL